MCPHACIDVKIDILHGAANSQFLSQNPLTMPYTFRQGDLPKLDLQVDKGSDFKAWKAQWQAYYSLSGLSGEPDATQVQALTLCFSRETIPIVDNLGLSEEQRGKVTSIIAGIEQYVQGQIQSNAETSGSACNNRESRSTTS